jgi:tetratricopeptide (TPR) repeat protein
MTARHLPRLALPALRAVLAGIAMAAGLSSAHAASTTFGSGPARACFEAAITGQTSAAAIAECDAAINGQDLNLRDRTATIVNRGVLRLLRREPMQALGDFDFALRARPELGEAHVNRGAALVMLSRLDEAIAAINRGLELGTADPHEAYFNRALAHERKGDVQAAYQDFLKAQALKPDWPLPGVELARFSVRPR